MKFSKEEISLCKQVAEKHKKKIEYGDWYLNEKSNIPYLWKSIPPFKYIHKNIIPLWTISDCLEFLNDRGWNAVTLSWRMEEVGDKPEIAYCEIVHDNFYEVKEKKALNHVMDFEAKTRLEVCLKAVLAVLGEE